MIVVTVKLWPKGDRTRERVLGELEIANDGTGTLEVGNYRGLLRAEYTGPAGRPGQVRGFRRRRQSVWTLIGAFLKQWHHVR